MKITLRRGRSRNFIRASNNFLQKGGSNNLLGAICRGRSRNFKRGGGGVRQNFLQKKKGGRGGGGGGPTTYTQEQFVLQINKKSSQKKGGGGGGPDPLDIPPGSAPDLYKQILLQKGVVIHKICIMSSFAALFLYF